MQGEIDGMNIEIGFRYIVPDDVIVIGMTKPVKRITQCRVVITDGTIVETVKGNAFCIVDDQFVKSIGRKIALTRAIAKLHREERRRIWQLYLNNVKY